MYIHTYISMDGWTSGSGEGRLGMAKVAKDPHLHSSNQNKFANKTIAIYIYIHQRSEDGKTRTN